MKRAGFSVLSSFLARVSFSKARSKWAALLSAVLLLSPLTPLVSVPAQASATPITLLTNDTAGEVTDMRFLATRSQSKPLSKSGVGPYVMTHTNANPALSYSYPTDANYGVNHSQVTNRTQQLFESDVREPNGMSFSYGTGSNARTASSAVLINSGNINSRPIGSNTVNTTVDGTPSYGSIFGPEVWSAPFSATTGQSVSFEWKAQGGGDDYEIYGFLVSVSVPSGGTCSTSTDRGGSTDQQKLASHSILAHARGKTASVYNTASGTVPADGCYRFRFVNGTYDASGGYLVGATFYIQNPTLGLAHNISFTQLADRVVQGTTYTETLIATTNAGATVTFAEYADTNSVCSISGSTLTINPSRAGQCTIRADAPSTGSYAAAPTVYMSFNVLASATKPVYSGGASVSGSALVCSTLTAVEGTWASGGANITSTDIQWLSNGNAIAGATGSTYTLSASDVGDSISFSVTKTNSVGSTTATSSGLLVIDARLTGLTLSSGTLSPSFDTCTSSYTITSTTGTISATPTISAGADSISVNGSEVLSGEPTNPLPLSPGANTITLSVASGIFSRNITVTVNYLAPPSVVALSPVMTSGTQVDLRASINANGFDTSSIQFTIVQTGGATQTPTQGSLSVDPVTGSSPTTVTQTVTDLVSGGTYEFTAAVTNQNGTTTSNTVTFQTPDAPSVTTGAASNVTSTGADLSAVVTGNSRETTVVLEFSTNSDLSSPTTVQLPLISSTDAANPQTVTESLTSLQTGIEYFYRFRASNAVGLNVGDIKSFVTSAAPSITHATHSIAERSVELFATINANGADINADIKFVFSTNSSFTSPVEYTAVPARIVAGSDRLVSVTISSLTPNTDYWFRVTATNSVGTTTSTAEQIKTLVDPAPSVTLQAASSVTVGAPISLTVRFSEAVTGFQNTDLSVSGTPSYTAGVPQDLGSGVYQVTLTTSSSSTGTVTIGLPSGRVFDAGNQGNTAATSISVTVQPVQTNPTVTLSYANQIAPLGASPTLNKGGSNGAATYSLLNYTGATLAPGCSVNSSTGVVTVTGEGECRIGVSVAATATFFAASAESLVSFTRSTETITWTSTTVTVRNSAGVDRTETLALNPDYPGSSATQYTLEIKLGDTVKLPFNSPNNQRVGYTSYFKCPSVIGWDQSVMFPFDGSGNSFYFVQAKRIGACSEATDQNNQRVPSSQFLTLPENLYTTRLSPGIAITVVKGDQSPISVTGASSANFGDTVTLDATGGSGLGGRTYAVTGSGCSISTIPFSFGGRTYTAFATAELTKTGAGSCDVTVTKAGDTNYEPVTSAPFTVTFSQGSQEISFTSAVPTNPTPGSSYRPAASASSGELVTITAAGTCTITSGLVTFTSSGTCTITATQAGNSDYLAAPTITQVVEVGIRNQSITFSAISDKEYGDPAFRIAPTSSESNLTVALTSANTGVCTVDSNGIVVLVSAGTCTIHADQSGTVSVVAAASRVSRSFTVYPAGSSAPFITSVSRGLGSLTATLVSPSHTGGATISRYEVQAFDAAGNLVGFNNNCSVATAPAPQKCTVDGLVEGVNYTLRARAHHTGGTGSISPASAAYSPVGNPDAVRELTAIADNTSLTITWLAPLDLGGATFTRYDVYIKLASENSFPGTASHVVNSVNAGSYTFTGLINGESYDVKMVTITSIDTTEVTSNSALVSQIPFTTPNAVRDLTAIEVGDDIFISWRYPDFDGGRAISNYDVDINSGALSCTSVTTLYCEVAKGSDTSFVIGTTANNVAGVSPAALFTFTLQSQSLGSGNNVFFPPTQPTIPSLSTPSLDEQLPVIEAGSPVVLELRGSNLNLITSIRTGSLRLQYQIVSNELIRVTLPSRASGELVLVLSYTGGTLEQEIRVQSGDKRINAGSFKGVVAIYAKGYLGQRLSAKVGEDWVIVNRVSGDFFRVLEPTRWVGKPLKVRIFIDRRLVRIVDVVTR